MDSSRNELPSDVAASRGENTTASDSEKHPADTDLKPWRASTQIRMILACLSVVSLVVALDATILVPALPTIAKALNGSASETFWAGTAYLLTSSTSQPLVAALSDVFGRREALLVSIGFFTVGTLITCLAQNFTTLLVGRSVKGIGGGGIIALNLVIMTDIIPLRQRPKYNGWSQVAWALGTITGPLLGGAIVEKTTWRLLFYINFPFCAIGLLSVPWIVRLDRPKVGLRASLAKIDWGGSGLFLGSTTAFLIGITWAGHSHPWSSYQVLVPLLVGVVGIVVFAAWEVKVAAVPFLRRTMLRSRPLMTTYACTILQGFLLYAHIYYVALFLLSVKRRSPILTGVALLPISCGLMPASAFCGVAVSRLGKWRWAVWLGWAVNVLGSGLLILLDHDTPVAGWFFIFLTLGLGQGLLLSAHNFAVQAIASVEDVAYATALFAFMRGVGLCLGVGIGGSIFQVRLHDLLDRRGLPVFIAENAEAFIFELFASDPDSAGMVLVMDAFRDAFRFLFIILTGICGAALLLSLTIPGYFSLDKDLDSRHALRTNTVATTLGQDLEAKPGTRIVAR